MKLLSWKVFLTVTLIHPALLSAQQVDISGPPGSVAFGKTVSVLPNGSFVVTDPSATVAGMSKAGAVYLYSPTGAQVSVVAGSAANDQVGSGGVKILGSGNYVISSPLWGSGAGAITFGYSDTGVSGTVSASTSLTGATSADQVGSGGVLLLSNGNYVVSSPHWSNGASTNAGAVTWGNGASGISGIVSTANSLAGTASGDAVGSGGVTGLSNGNYVVGSPQWSNAGTKVGAVTWADGAMGIFGTVSTTNSLTGATAGDAVGLQTVALTNGNYVVGSTFDNAGNANYAVTWGNGSLPTTGTVSVANSLIDGPYIVPLRNGNYVVCNSGWNGSAGAVTWADGGGITTGSVSAANSLTGSAPNDQICSDGVYALTNGNYVVASSLWPNGAVAYAGAVTWVNGGSSYSGTVSAANSLVGTTDNDSLGALGGVTPLANGNYVVSSHRWTNGSASAAGAVTWGNGNSGVAGPVSAANSLVGTNSMDWVGWTVTALTGGNYVVGSYRWNHDLGAATWGDGNTGVAGVVSSTNSLVGNCPGNQVTSGAPEGLVALTNGNYVVASPNWCIGSAQLVGASTWGRGDVGLVGTISTTNSFTGTSAGDYVGFSSRAFSDGNYAIYNIAWHGIGAITFGAGASGARGNISASNSVLGRSPGAGQQMMVDYDPSRLQLVVGQPAANLVSLLSDRIFRDGYE